MDVSILIVTYNSEEEIVACLQSVLLQQQHVTQEIIVVDNGSTDATVAVVREAFPDVTLVTPKCNLGFAAGVNEAARHARGEFLLLLNPDAEILDHAVDRIVEFARQSPQWGLYGGRTLKADGSLEPFSCLGLPTLWTLVLFATGISAIGRNHPWLNPESLGGWQRDTVREVGVVTGGFLLIARTTWIALGGFNPRFFMYGEDVDLAFRARKAGYKPVVCPWATVRHDMGSSSATPIARLMLLYRGKATLLRTHWSGLSRVIALGLLGLGVGVRACCAALAARLCRRPFRETWIALWQRKRDWMPGYPATRDSLHS